MKHQFYPGRDDSNFVDATVIGYLDYESGKAGIRSFEMVTDKATYVKEEFGVAVRSVTQVANKELLP